MVGPVRGCFSHLHPAHDGSVSGLSSNHMMPPADFANGAPTLSDLVRESEPEDMPSNPKAKEANAEHVTPLTAAFPTPVLGADGIPIPDLWFFPGDRESLWTYSRAPPPSTMATEFQDSPTLPMRAHPREIMARYTTRGGWRTLPRGHYAGSRFGAVGERLVPLTLGDITKETNEDVETHDSP